MDTATAPFAAKEHVLEALNRGCALTTSYLRKVLRPTRLPQSPGAQARSRLQICVSSVYADEDTTRGGEVKRQGKKAGGIAFAIAAIFLSSGAESDTCRAISPVLRRVDLMFEQYVFW
ncbi:hypothetical protein PC129_g14189 [Phytophthora cactorum]|uniref:Uncharacterized protein n=1 Tax=Phytophthora cactorum TaxID=29920 RepID=A0A8T1HR67_9STRA|nr:hypothetical protein PC112_g15051 [Phytophthora cactorum]KAG2814436.1 hypothetical protein PC111_g13979 [Phytophthora cactorum]KAG2852228.1 hypothetical protein PC113_g15208 [Phytophthora cactorum]KAG3018199.1 hypothetical protein PC120_g10559 [Phytophthora cactorum]KAG3073038.1 hypothetical protein PC122_g14966 [Phytophthora cactorum]